MSATETPRVDVVAPIHSVWNCRFRHSGTGFMEQRLAEGQPPPVRTVDNVDALKAMADRTRLAILAALMKSRHDLPVMSVKELAAELGEPQTKLYRHVRQLEAAGLIKVASTRMVSGILEQRYQACQQDLMLGRGFLQEHANESEAAGQAVLDRYRDGFFAALMSDRRVSPAKAAELRHKLEEIMNDLNDEKTEDPDGVPLSLLIGCFVPAQPSGRCGASR